MSPPPIHFNRPTLSGQTSIPGNPSENADLPVQNSLARRGTSDVALAQNAQQHQARNIAPTAAQRPPRNERYRLARTLGTLDHNRGNSPSGVATGNLFSPASPTARAPGTAAPVGETGNPEGSIQTGIQELIYTDPVLMAHFGDLARFKTILEMAHQGLGSTYAAIDQHLSSLEQATLQNIHEMDVQADEPARPPAALPTAADDPLVFLATQAAQENSVTVAADTTQPSSLQSLRDLGYSETQTLQIKPLVQATVVENHRALTSLGFNRDEIIWLSHSPPATALCPKTTIRPLFQVLPDLTTDQFMHIARLPARKSIIDTMLQVAEGLKSEPLNLTTNQIFRIAKNGHSFGLQTVHSLRNRLVSPPISLDSEQIMRLASHSTGYATLQKIETYLPFLNAPPSPLRPEDALTILSQKGGRATAQMIEKEIHTLTRPPYAMSRQDLLSFSAVRYAHNILQSVLDHLPALIREPYSLDVKLIYGITRSKGPGSRAGRLSLLHKLLNELTSPPFNCNMDELKALTRRDGAMINALRDKKTFMLEQMRSNPQR